MRPKTNIYLYINLCHGFFYIPKIVVPKTLFVDLHLGRWPPGTTGPLEGPGHGGLQPRGVQVHRLVAGGIAGGVAAAGTGGVVGFRFCWLWGPKKSGSGSGFGVSKP